MIFKKGKMQLRIAIVLLAFLIAAGTISAQKANKKIMISGIVVDGNRKPVPNVFITIDGKASNSVTDEKGFYKIKVSPTAEKIGFSTIWSQGAEELINGRTTINHVYNLPSPVNKPASGGGNPSNDLANSSGTDKNINKDFTSYKTIYELIQAEFPTVIVEGKSIRIPGSVSLKLSTEPLFIVDGIEATSIDNIIPSTVRSVQVLKGSSASIYGMKGANGVIKIELRGATDKNNNKK